MVAGPPGGSLPSKATVWACFDIRHRHAALGLQPAAPVEQDVHGVRGKVPQGVVRPAPLAKLWWWRV